MKTMKLAPSILSADYANFERESDFSIAFLVYLYDIGAVSSYAVVAKGVEICRKRDSFCSFSLVFVQYFKSVFTIF